LINQDDDDKFFVEPLKFPAIMTKLSYTLEPSDTSLDFSDFACDGTSYFLENVYHIRNLYKVAPPGKQNCFVQIYLNPVSCTRPGILQSSVKRHTRENNARPPTNLLFTILDHRFPSGTTDYYGTKCCTYYIHVEVQKSGWKSRLEIFRKGTPHFADLMLDQYQDMQFENSYFFSSKLTFWIQSISTNAKLYTVTEMAILLCKNHQDYFDQMHRDCENAGNTESELWECALQYHNENDLMTQIAVFPKQQNSQQIRNHLQINCDNIYIDYQGNSLDIFPQSFYLRQYNPLDTDLDPIFLNLMFPNSSIINKNTHLYNLVRIPTYRTLKSLGITDVFVVSSRFNAIQFVTCSPLKQPGYLSLLGYISAFDVPTWLLILLCFILSVWTWNYIAGKTKKRKFEVMFVAQILLGQSSSEIQYVRLVTGAWVLAGVVLTYNYQGNNIDQLTSPIGPKKIETFEQVLSNNFTVYSLPMEYDNLRVGIAGFGFDPGELYLMLGKYWYPRETNFGKLFVHQRVKTNTKDLQAELEHFVKYPKNKAEWPTMIPFGFYEEALSKCGQDVFADTFPNVNKLRSRLLSRNVDEAQISQSKTAFGQLNQFTYFYNVQITPEDYARRRFGIVESGLIHLWNEWKYRVESWNDAIEAAKQLVPSTKSISLDDNIIVVFYVDLSLKLMCLGVFTWECKKYFNTFLSHTAISVFTGFKLIFSSCGSLILFMIQDSLLRSRFTHTTKVESFGHV